MFGRQKSNVTTPITEKGKQPMSKTEDRGPILETHSPGLHGNGNSTGTYYKVEYRSTTSMTKVVGDGREPFPFVIDHYWRTLSIQQGAQQWGVNIPIRPWDGEACKHGLVSHVAAEAHRWAFLAALEAGAAGAGGALCVETRLVAVELQQSYSTKEIGVTPQMTLQYKPSGIEPRGPKATIQDSASSAQAAE
jgi:hypothetical protein